MSGSFVYTIDGKVKFWETVRCFYEDHSASTQPPRRLPRAGGRAADELFAAACGVAPARGDGGVAGPAVLQRRMAQRRLAPLPLLLRRERRRHHPPGRQGALQSQQLRQHPAAEGHPHRRDGSLPRGPLHPRHGGAHFHPLRRRRQCRHDLSLRRERHPLGRAAHPAGRRRRLGLRERHHRRHPGVRPRHRS